MVLTMLPATSLIAIFIFSFIVGFGAVISPGPISTAIVSQAPRRGWRVGPLVAAGHSLMELALVLMIALGLGAGLARPGVQTLIALAGGSLLVWMGFGMMVGAWRGRTRLPSTDQQVKSMNPSQLVGLGILATGSNPFWYAWWVTVAAGYLSQARALSLAAVLAFFLGHISADFLWDTFLSAVVGGGRRWMTDNVYRGLILACGIFFLYLGSVFLARGVSAVL